MMAMGSRLLVTLLLVATLLAGCTKPRPDSNGAASASLTIKGSDTLVQLAQAWAQGFMKTHPEISVTVTGGGSNTGIAALLNKGTDIANASRPMKPEEFDKAKANGIDVKEVVVARDALSIVVNPKNPVAELTMQQLADIYSGKITNWREVGGPDTNIVASGRDSSSGTYVFFQEHVLHKGPYGRGVLSQISNSQIASSVAEDVGGVGYIGLGYIDESLKDLKIKANDSAPGVAGNLENVKNGTYPLARPLFEYFVGEPKGAAEVWKDWILGPEGQKLVENLGFITAK
jgi:phosphate transport system substrate-binding protein